MGLDMVCMAVPAALPAEVDFKEPTNGTQLHRWRRHPNLHGWMERLYHEKDGTDPEFNCVPVALEASDIDRLEADIKARSLPHTEGFFFGHSDRSEMEEDLHFIKKARETLARGLNRNCPNNAHFQCRAKTNRP